MLNFESKLFIYILNWNQADMTVACAQSILAQEGACQFDLFIIDNGSTDDSLQIFQRELPNIALIKNKENLGFQGGMNAGIRHALKENAEYIMLLNNDTIAAPDMLAQLINFFPEEAGLVSPGNYYHENRNYLCSLGGNFHPVFLEVLGIPKSFYKPPNEIQQYEFLPAHAWLFKKEVFEMVGLFDETYFPIYYDDLDFCYRMTKKKIKAFLIPQSKIFHRVSMSVGGRNSPKERYLMARNSGYYFRKNMKYWQAPIIFTFRLGSGLLWTFRLLYKGNFSAVKSYWKGFFDGWFRKLPR